MTRGLHRFRNDLRLRDDTLEALAAQAAEWLPVFVLDPRILADAGVGEPRTRLLLDCLGRSGGDLEKRAAPLLVREGRPDPGLLGRPDPRPAPVRHETRACDIATGGEEAAKRSLARFLDTAAGRHQEGRDRPDRDGTSRLSPYLCFGVISVRQCSERAGEAAGGRSPGLERDPKREGQRVFFERLVDITSAVMKSTRGEDRSFWSRIARSSCCEIMSEVKQ